MICVIKSHFLISRIGSTIHEEIGEGGDQAKNQAVLEMDMETWEVSNVVV